MRHTKGTARPRRCRQRYIDLMRCTATARTTVEKGSVRQDVRSTALLLMYMRVHECVCKHAYDLQAMVDAHKQRYPDV